MITIKKRLDRVLFEPATADALGMWRAFTCGWLLVALLFIDLVQFGLLPEAVYQPVSLFRIFNLPQVEYATLRILYWVWVGVLVLACVGAGSRISVPVAALIGFILLGVMNNYGKIHHSYNLPMMLLFVLAFSRCGEGFSLDALIGRRPAHCGSDPDYGWPLALGRIAFAVLMGLGGLSKIFGNWIPPDLDAFEFLFARGIAIAELKGFSMSPLTLWFANNGLLAMVAAYIAMVLELAAPIALFRGGLVRFVIVGGLLGMQVFNALVLGIHINVPWLAGYVVFLPLDALSARWRLGASPKSLAAARPAQDRRHRVE